MGRVTTVLGLCCCAAAAASWDLPDCCVLDTAVPQSSQSEAAWDLYSQGKMFVCHGLRQGIPLHHGE